ncbi:MAG: hypothetical protein H7Y30_00845 [Pyrinomonadaceae bacterium]|nr:hypothetical protein [Pyrinomonadaceae bacterium]
MPHLENTLPSGAKRYRSVEPASLALPPLARMARHGLHVVEFQMPHESRMLAVSYGIKENFGTGIKSLRVLIFEELL